MTAEFAFTRPHPLLRVLLWLVGAGGSPARVELDSDVLRVRFGVGFAATVPLASVTAATRDTERVLAWGAHGFAGRWLVNTSSHGMVALTLDPVARGWVLGFPVRLRVLRLSLADPDGFLAALAERRRA